MSMTTEGILEEMAKGTWDPEKIGYVHKITRCHLMEQRYQHYVELVFETNGWPGWLRQDWLIFGAKWVPCPVCNAERGKPCRNMTDYKAGRHPYRFVKWPHTQRVPFRIIFERFVQLGFIERFK